MSYFLDEEEKNISIDEDFFKLSSSNFQKLFQKKTCYIFGKNGSGKTTISRQILFKLKKRFDLFVFNKDYIKNNVFIQDSNNENFDIQKISPNNKKKTFEIILGTSLIEIVNKINDNENNISINKKILEESFYINEDLKNNLFFLKISKPLYQKNDFQTATIRRNIIKNISSLEEKEKILEELKLKINSIKKFDKREDISKLFNSLLEKINEQNININNFSNYWNKFAKSQKIIDLHNKALELSEPEGVIEFIGKEFKKKEIEEYLSKNSSNKNIIFGKLKEQQIKISKLINIILININNLDKDNWLNDLYIKTKEIEEKNNIIFQENKKIDFNFQLYDKNELDIEKEKQEAKDFLNKHWITLIIKNEEIENIIENLNSFETLLQNKNSLKIEKQNLQEEFKEDFIVKINKVIEHISKNEFNINLNDSTRGDDHFLELVSKNKKIENLSEGEKTTLAISYFLVDFWINYKKINKNYIIFIDDPFDSNDHFKYDNLFNFKFNIEELEINFTSLLGKIEESKNINGRLIISTHNINILSAFIRNLKNERQDKNDLFFKIKHENSINLVHLEKKDNQAEVIELDIDLFFPKEEKMTKYINISLNSNDLNKIDEIEKQIYLLICCLKVKMLDIYENYSKIRGKTKEFVNKNRENINFNFSINDIKKFLQKFYSNNDEVKINSHSEEKFAKYLFFIKKRYEKILKSNDEQAYNRLRHKNNYYSMPIGHIIEE
ncbi:MAG: AAA family ATPase [Metamycoplasmataceae bacterium]